MTYQQNNYHRLASLAPPQLHKELDFNRLPACVAVRTWKDKSLRALLATGNHLMGSECAPCCSSALGLPVGVDAPVIALYGVTCLSHRLTLRLSWTWAPSCPTAEGLHSLTVCMGCLSTQATLCTLATTMPLSKPPMGCGISLMTTMSARCGCSSVSQMAVHLLCSVCMFCCCVL